MEPDLDPSLGCRPDGPEKERDAHAQSAVAGIMSPSSTTSVRPSASNILATSESASRSSPSVERHVMDWRMAIAVFGMARMTTTSLPRCFESALLSLRTRWRPRCAAGSPPTD